MKKLLPQGKFYWRLLLLTTLSSGFNLQASAQTSWATVRIGGGGNVTSIKPHPAVPNLFFATTDVGNPYRWNHTDQKWEGLLNGVPLSQANNSACGNIAVDPQDATGNILYATVGKYANYTYSWAPAGKVLNQPIAERPGLMQGFLSVFLRMVLIKSGETGSPWILRTVPWCM